MNIKMLDDTLVNMEELVNCASGEQLITLGYLVDKKLKEMTGSMPGLDLAQLKHQLIQKYESGKQKLHTWLSE